MKFSLFVKLMFTINKIVYIPEYNIGLHVIMTKQAPKTSRGSVLKSFGGSNSNNPLALCCPRCLFRKFWFLGSPFGQISCFWFPIFPHKAFFLLILMVTDRLLSSLTNPVDSLSSLLPRFSFKVKVYLFQLLSIRSFNENYSRNN